MVTLSDVARMAGISRQRAHALAKRPDFPAPFPLQASRRLWEEAKVQAWVAERQKRLAR